MSEDLLAKSAEVVVKKKASCGSRRGSIRTRKLPGSLSVKEIVSLQRCCGYKYFNARDEELRELWETCPGYVYIDFEATLRLQLTVNINWRSETEVLEILWNLIDKKTAYFTVTGRGAEESVAGIPKSTRVRDKARRDDGSLFKSNYVKKACHIIGSCCTNVVATEIVKEVLWNCDPSLRSCVIWDAKAEFIAERSNTPNVEHRISAVQPSKILSTARLCNKVLLLVNTRGLVDWLKTYLKDFSYIKDAVNNYLMINNLATDMYRLDMDDSYQMFIDRIRDKRDLKISDCFLTLVRNPRFRS